MFVFLGFSSHAHLPSAHFSVHFFPFGGRLWLSSGKAALLQVGGLGSSSSLQSLISTSWKQEI